MCLFSQSTLNNSVFDTEANRASENTFHGFEWGFQGVLTLIRPYIGDLLRLRNTD